MKTKTKSEAIKEMQAACDAINKYLLEPKMVYVVQHNEFVYLIDADDLRVSYRVKCLPDPKPPEKYAGVLVVVNTTSFIKNRVTKGKFDKHGDLLCLTDKGGECAWPHWYDPKTGNHSLDFPMDKIPEEFRK